MKMKTKIINVLAALTVILLALAMIVFSWGVTCGIIKLITLCFGWEFSWGSATGIYLIMVLFNWMRPNGREK